MSAGGERCCRGEVRGAACLTAGKLTGALAGTVAPVGTTGRSDSGEGAPGRPGSEVRQAACCSQRLQEYIIYLLSKEARKHVHRWPLGEALKPCQPSKVLFHETFLILVVFLLTFFPKLGLLAFCNLRSISNYHSKMCEKGNSLHIVG